MKCDELKATEIYARFAEEVYDDFGDSPQEQEYYRKEHADAAITELKARIHELESMPHTDNSAVIERISNENERLKAKLESVKATAYAESVDAGMENRKLKRALWLARAERARDNSILLPSKFMRNVWDNVERKCLAKAKEYK